MKSEYNLYVEELCLGRQRMAPDWQWAKSGAVAYGAFDLCLSVLTPDFNLFFTQVNPRNRPQKAIAWTDDGLSSD